MTDHAQEFPFTVGAIFANLIHELPSLVVSDNFNQILYTKKEAISCNLTLKRILHDDHVRLCFKVLLHDTSSKKIWKMVKLVNKQESIPTLDDATQ